MRRFTLSLSLGLLALLLVAMPVVAGRAWCMRDPIVRLNGEDVGIWVAIPEEYESLVTGAVQVRIHTPVGVSRQLIYMDAGFNGYGEEVRFTSSDQMKTHRDGSFDVVIEAWVPIDKKGLKEMGIKSKTIPFQITVITNGTLATYENGTMEVVDGVVNVVEQTNDKTKISFTVEPSK